MPRFIERCRRAGSWLPFQFAFLLSTMGLFGPVRQLCAAPPSKPNIVFILADDLGWHDLACYGNEWFETPNLDRLASQGLRMTQAYAAAPICSASRAALLTGKTPARLGFEFVTKNEEGVQPMDTPLQSPPYTLDLPLSEVTIAESLGSAGYETAFFGKWHLNRHYKRYLGWSPTHGPKSQGFQVAEEDFGSHPYSYWNDQTARPFTDEPVDEFPSDSMTQRAVDYIGKQHDQPYFLMVSHFYVHTPVHTRLRWLHARYLSKIPTSHPRREALAHYGSMVTTLDHLVGRVLDAIDDAGQSESTLVIFTSDNGGHPEYAGNAPLRGSKWNLYEGGIRVPLILRWPGKIEAGLASDAVVSGIDLHPTLACLAGATIPDNVDGHSLCFTWDETVDEPPPRSILWHFPYYHPERQFHQAPSKIGVDDGYTSQTRPHAALRSGPWKLLHFFEDDRNELYQLDQDTAEQSNQLHREPSVARRLQQDLSEQLESAQARLPGERNTTHP